MGRAGGGTSVTSYGYDVQDHLTAVTDAEASTTTYAYSDRDLLTAESSLVSGTTTHAYNAHGELVETVDARGVTELRSVDELDRVTFVDYPDYPDDSLDTTYTYDDPLVAFSLGRLTAIEPRRRERRLRLRPLRPHHPGRRADLRLRRKRQPSPRSAILAA